MAGELTSPQYAVLHVVGASPGVNQKRLGELAALDTSNTADIVARLARRGMARPSRGPAGQAWPTALPHRGVTRRIAELHPCVAWMQSSVLSPLPESDRAAFVEHLAHVAYAGPPPPQPR